MSEIEEKPLPRVEIDSQAPLFEARSTLGTTRLADYRGQWVVFFSHPVDFTPVCTSEFVGFQEHAGAFAARNCALIGLSVDSVYAHLAWIREIEARFGVRIEFPIVEDISMSIARAYGMIHDGSSSTAAVRAVYVIDPDGVLRASMHYPMNVGRSVPEILRLVTALQRADAAGVSTPEGWTEGAPCVLPPPASLEELGSRGEDGASWFYQETEGRYDA